MIDLRPFLTLSFWFNLDPLPPTLLASRVVFSGFIVLVIAGLVLRLFRHRSQEKLQRALLARVANLLTTMGLLGFIFFFFLYEQINFFGSHFWFLLWLIGVVVWIVTIVRFARIQVPAMRGQQSRQKERAKYLPKANA